MTTNYSVKQLSFSMEKILAVGCSSHNSAKTNIHDNATCPTSYLNSNNYGLGDLFNYSNFPYIQHLDTHHPVASYTNGFENVFGNPNTIIRPSPMRPVVKESVTVSTTSNQFGNNNCRRRSWSRAVFSSLQRKGLEKRFAIQKYITKPDRRQLAATLGLTDAQVKVWFQNRRMKWRHTKESEKAIKLLDDGTLHKSDSETSLFKTTNSDEKITLTDEEDIDVESDIS